MTALLGNAAFVARHGAEPGALADLEADAERLARTLDDLVALAREEGAGPPRRPRPAGRGRAAGRRRTGVGVIAPEPVQVRGDAAALERAVGEPDRERPAARAAGGPGHRDRRPARGPGAGVRAATRGRDSSARRPSGPSTASGAAPRPPGAPDPGSASPSSGARPSATAARRGSTPGASRIDLPAADDSQAPLKVAGYNPSAPSGTPLRLDLPEALVSFIREHPAPDCSRS